MSITENTFSVDDFENPKVLYDAEAIATLLTRLLLLEPGTIQSHPDAGVGLKSRYSMGVAGTSSSLQSEFQRQIETYLPQYQGVKVSVTEKDRAYIITAEIDNSLYGIYYDTSTSNINTQYTKLSNL